MKRIAIIITVLLLAVAVTAWAEYGKWTQKHMDPNYNNALLGVSAPDADDLFAVGVWTNNIDTFQFIWKSNDAGQHLLNIYQFQMSTDPAHMCDMLHITDARTSVWAFDPENGLFGGSGVDQKCIDSYGPDIGQQMICVIACAMTIGPTMWYTDDGGKTFKTAKIPYVNQASVQSISMVDDMIGYAVGLGKYVIKTIDGGKTWTKLPKAPTTSDYLNRVFFINENVGWIAAGDWDPDTSGKDELQGMDLIREQLHRQRLSSDPLYRHDYLQNLDPRKADKMLNGTILKTFDGGLNWTPEKQSASEGYDAIFFADENNGWVIGETYVPSTQSDIVAVYHTTDGGDTWNPVTNLPATITGTQGWYPSGVKFVNPQFGIMYGIASKGFGYAPAFLYTEDGGANWTVDKSALSLHGGEFDISFASPHVAYAVGLYLDLLRYESANAKPVANAGADFQTDLNVQASLDGSGSSDADGDTLKYAWTQVSGPTITLSDATAVKPTFTPTEAGDAQFQLVVNDGTEDSDPATVTVTIAPAGTDDDTTSGDDDSSPAGDDDNGDNSSGCGC